MGGSGRLAKIVFTLMEEFSKHVLNLNMNVKDNIRTPLHIVVAQEFTKGMKLIPNDAKTDLNSTVDMSTCEVDRAKNTVYDVEEISPLFLAITHNHIEVVKQCSAFQAPKKLDH